jgi:alkyl hydroperoxide reductase subunit AhpF
MLSERSLTIIRSKPGQLKKPVRLVLFTSDAGCEACPDVLELARAVKAQFNKLALETYDVVMDRDKSMQFGVRQTPALVVQGGEGETVAFYGKPEHLFLEVLLSTMTAVSESKVWFPENVRRALHHLANDVSIRVFVENDCPECRPVAETAIGLALESRLISTSIIVASDFPDLIKQYRISTLPKTIFGENLHMDGHVSESEFLEMVFQAEGLKPGPEKKCLVCGNTSPENICPGCKAKIQAEAVEHKLKGEKLSHPESL